MVVLVGAGLDGQEVSGLPGVRRVVFRFPFRTVSSSLDLNVRGTKPSPSATSTTHSGPGVRAGEHLLRMKPLHSVVSDSSNFSAVSHLGTVSLRYNSNKTLCTLSCFCLKPCNLT